MTVTATFENTSPPMRAVSCQLLTSFIRRGCQFVRPAAVVPSIKSCTVSGCWKRSQRSDHRRPMYLDQMAQFVKKIILYYTKICIDQSTMERSCGSQQRKRYYLDRFKWVPLVFVDNLPLCLIEQRTGITSYMSHLCPRLAVIPEPTVYHIMHHFALPHPTLTKQHTLSPSQEKARAPLVLSLPITANRSRDILTEPSCTKTKGKRVEEKTSNQPTHTCHQLPNPASPQLQGQKTERKSPTCVGRMTHTPWITPHDRCVHHKVPES